MRDAFGEAILEIGKTNPKVVALTADLEQSVKLTEFKNVFPERFINVGVAEANMIGIGVGLAKEGFIPFCTSFAVFLPGRCFDQIRVSVCQNNANVKLIGSHCGFTNNGDGATAQSIEDIALMRVLPNMKVVCPADSFQTEKAIKAVAKDFGPCYVRISKTETPIITSQSDSFEIGKAYKIREGKKVTIIACGTMVSTAFEAGKELDADVINLSTIKPLDNETILSSVKKTKKVITIEEHSVIGGMGSAVAEMLSQNYPVPIKIIGIPDVFGESARNYNELLDKYGLTAENIIRNYKNFL